MSGDSSEQDARKADRIRRRSQGTRIITKEVTLEYHEAPTYGFPPESALDDAVTSMVQAYNACGREGRGPILPGYVLRVRVVCGGKGKFEKADYSPLDRLVFDGKKAKSLFPGTEETSQVGKFAMLPLDGQGRFLHEGDVMCQIASYGTMEKKSKPSEVEPATQDEWRAFLSGERDQP